MPRRRLMVVGRYRPGEGSLPGVRQASGMARLHACRARVVPRRRGARPARAGPAAALRRHQPGAVDRGHADPLRAPGQPVLPRAAARRGDHRADLAVRRDDRRRPRPPPLARHRDHQPGPPGHRPRRRADQGRAGRRRRGARGAGPPYDAAGGRGRRHHGVPLGVREAEGGARPPARAVRRVGAVGRAEPERPQRARHHRHPGRGVRRGGPGRRLVHAVHPSTTPLQQPGRYVDSVLQVGHDQADVRALGRPRRPARARGPRTDRGCRRDPAAGQRRRRRGGAGDADLDVRARHRRLRHRLDRDDLGGPGHRRRAA